MALVSAAPYLALLSEQDSTLKAYALTSLNEIVDQLWAEIANNINDLEDLYEDDKFPDRRLAALVASKVYYNLGDFEASVKYALLAKDKFDLEHEQSQYIETIVSQCINLYISLRRTQFESGETGAAIDPQLSLVFERMLNKCITNGDYKLALGIALDSYRSDVIESILRERIESDNEESALQLVNYVLACCNSMSMNLTLLKGAVDFKTVILKSLIDLVLTLKKKNQDYFTIFKIIVQLNDSKLATDTFQRLLRDGENLIAYQGAFDLVNTATQELLDTVITGLQEHQQSEEEDQRDASDKLLHILSGVPTCDYDTTFLFKNNNTDITILNKTKNLLEGRSSIFHSAVTFANAFMHAGTTDDSFFRKNLEWLGKATNWSKFSATAALGVIHKGNLSQGRNILKPYLPGASGAPHTKGGSLFALGLIFAGHGREILDYLKKFIDEQGNSAGNTDTDVMLHGACLGCGVAGMSSQSEPLYESLKVVLYSDSATSGQAAGLAMGLIMLGSGNEQVITDMITYAKETQHENIIRSLAIGVSLLNYGREDFALPTINDLMEQESSILRYGGVFTISLAYAGTSNNQAIKKLLHHAVSDPSDDVRRAAVMGLGFILIRDFQSVPTIVELLLQSHNPHVRYGAAMALGILCAGRNVPAAIKILEPLSKDPVDFVRQGALIATSMILIQTNELTTPKVKTFTKQLADTIKNKHEDALAKFGATLAQGIIDAGGRNVTINLENAQTNTLNVKAIVGLTVFAQSWYWFPLAHFLSLSFAPTALIGVTENLKIPKFKVNCHAKPELFQYPPKAEEVKEKQPDKIATAVLSTTNRARARANKKKKIQEDDDEDNMEVEEPATTKSTEKAGNAGDKKDDTKSTEGNVVSSNAGTDEEVAVVRYNKVPYKISNLTRVLPIQSTYVSFIKDDRFVPARKFNRVSGIIVLEDTEPSEKVEVIKTVRQMNVTEAPLPKPFTLSGEDLEDEDCV
jgi:26S proteasome regulatory subunit N2